MTKNKCPNKYHCDFTCNNCIYDDIAHFRRLFDNVNDNLAKNSFAGSTPDFTENLIVPGDDFLFFRNTIKI